MFYSTVCYDMNRVLFVIYLFALDLSGSLRSSTAHRLHEMLRICLAASGEEVTVVEAGNSDYASIVSEQRSTVGSVKRYLAEKHFHKRVSRFQLRILRAGDPHFLEDDEGVTAPQELQLVVLSHLPPDEDRDRKFLDACLQGETQEVEQKLKALQHPHIPVGDQNLAPLFAATLSGLPRVVTLLIEAGADIEWQSQALNGCTSLAGAAFTGARGAGGQLEAMRLLLDHGANMECTDGDLGTPLHLAAGQNNAQAVRLLLDRKANIEAEDRNGCRALHFAALRGHRRMMELLREAGAAEAKVGNYTPTTLAVSQQRRKERWSFLEREARRHLRRRLR